MRARVVFCCLLLAALLTPEIAAPSVDGTWTRLPLIVPEATAYDPVGDRIFGFTSAIGIGPPFVWQRPADGSSEWRTLQPLGVGPIDDTEGYRFDVSIQHAFYDAANHRVLVIAGLWTDDASIWAIELDPFPTWVSLVPSFGPPAASREDASAIFDAARNRIVIYAGDTPGGSWSSDVWEIALGPSPTVSELFPTGPQPDPRRDHSAVYDAVGDRMLVFGGTTGISNDVWSLSLAGAPEWSLLTTTGVRPATRFSHAGTIGDGAMWIFGGRQPGNPSVWVNDLWRLDLATLDWSQVLPAGALPSPRYLAHAVHDAARNDLVLLGGWGPNGGIAADNIWSIDLDAAPAWAYVGPPGEPPPGMENTSGTYDPARQRMLVYGGNAIGDLDEETWALSLADDVWARLVTGGTQPPGRRAPSSVFDTDGDRLVVFGGTLGNYGGAIVNEVWALDFDDAPPSWSQLTPLGVAPSGRVYHSMIYDPIGHRAIVFGGFDGSNDVSEVWELSLSPMPTWTQLTPAGVAPTARRQHSAIYDPVGHRMIVFGGSSGGDETWALDLAGSTSWTQLNITAPPPARYWHSAIYDADRHRMVIHGGGHIDFNDTWALSLGASPAWTELQPTGPQAWHRGNHVAIYDAPRDRMIVHTGVFYDHTTWALNWSGIVSADVRHPERFQLGPAIPNPSRRATSIALRLPAAGHVEATVFDLSGRRVQDIALGVLPGGRHELIWDGSNHRGLHAQPGLYFLQVRFDGATLGRKVLRIQ